MAWAPFDRPTYRVAWQGNDALTFAWDETGVRAMLDAVAAPAQVELLPETLMREPHRGSGVRVLNCVEGVEAQAWRDGAIVASRWWPQMPDADEALLWLRSLGSEAADATTLPPPVAVEWRRRPVQELQGLVDLRSTTSRMERVAVGTTLVALAGLGGVQAHQTWAAHAEREAVRSELDRQRREAAPVLAARDRAESAARELQALADQVTGVLPIELLQFLSDVLPPAGITLRELELTGRRVRLALELSSDVQRSQLVSDLQTGGWLTRVTEIRDSTARGWVQFEAELAGVVPPAVALRPPRVPSTARPGGNEPATPTFPPGVEPAAVAPRPPRTVASPPLAEAPVVHDSPQAAPPASRTPRQSRPAASSP